MLGFWAEDSVSETTTRVLTWPNSLLQTLVPCHNVGTPESPLCEGTPVNLLAYILSYALAWTSYSVIAYLALRPRVHHVA
jgi:hypothetical protein